MSPAEKDVPMKPRPPIERTITAIFRGPWTDEAVEKVSRLMKMGAETILVEDTTNRPRKEPHDHAR